MQLLFSITTIQDKGNGNDISKQNQEVHVIQNHSYMHNTTSSGYKLALQERGKSESHRVDVEIDFIDINLRSL